VKLPFAVATTTWNSADLIDGFLAHYERLGASVIFVTDLGSTDGTLEILDSPRWQGTVHRHLPESPLEADSLSDLLEVARSTLGDAWCLFCDPDEFLVTPAMSLYDTCTEDAACVIVPERNMTARRSAAEGTGEELSPFEALTLRIDRRHRRSRAEKLTQEPLAPPWIFTDHPGKVVVRLPRVLSISAGAHFADTAEGPPRKILMARSSPTGCCLLHYPMRTYEAFRRKIDMAELHIGVYYGEAGPPRKKGGVPRHGWTYHRWIGCRDRGELHEEYLAQFVPDEQVADLLADGTLVEDTRVRDFQPQSV
jgi:hypothetical protein